jgi:hypothetical protein
MNAAHIVRQPIPINRARRMVSMCLVIEGLRGKADGVIKLLHGFNGG